MPTTASLTLCQYCEHANPADAKFCAGCGAPLHLVPCPHCGAVNQKTSKSCYQCHGELRESTEILLASVPASVSEEAAGDAASTALLTPYRTQEKTPQRQPVFVIIIILAAFAAAAYFAYQQRSHVAIKTTPVPNPSPVGDALPGKPADGSPGNLSAGAINKAAPAAKGANDTEPPPAIPGKDAAANQPALAIDAKLGTVEEARERSGEPKAPDATRTRSGRRGVPAEAYPSTGLVTAPGSAIEKRAPRINNCTESIAALGLCTPAPTKGN